MREPAAKRSSHLQPPPRPTTRPKVQSPPQPSTSTASTNPPRVSATTRSSGPGLRHEVFRASIFIFHSSLLFVSYLTWTSLFILLLPAFCISYCIRQIGLLLAQHRRSRLVETLSSLSLHYLHGEDAGRNTIVVIYLGSPGIKIAALKRLLVQRIFSAGEDNNSERSTSGSRPMKKWFAEHLQQTVVSLPMGYAWQRLVMLQCLL